MDSIWLLRRLDNSSWSYNGILLFQIEHAEHAYRENARRMLTELIAVLMPPVELTYEKPRPPVKVETRPKRDFNFNNIARTDELPGWNEPVGTDGDRVSKEP